MGVINHQTSNITSFPHIVEGAKKARLSHAAIGWKCRWNCDVRLCVRNATGWLLALKIRGLDMWMCVFYSGVNIFINVQKHNLSITSMYNTQSGWLVVRNMNFMTFPSYLGNVIIPTDELHHFSEGFKPPTSQYIFHLTGPQSLLPLDRETAELVPVRQPGCCSIFWSPMLGLRISR